jgi:hypothetical protein
VRWFCLISPCCCLSLLVLCLSAPSED